MRLLEAIVAGDQRTPLELGEAFRDSVPVIVFTCIDPRLNPLIPKALRVREEQFIWLRNAGNIITGPMSSTMRSLALACAVKGGKEIAVIGHTDCLVCKTTMLSLTERFRQFGVERSQLPDNLVEFFGLFASERQNVLKAAEFVRQSPLIGRKVPVHGLLLDIATGRLEWLNNGYEALNTVTSGSVPTPRSTELASASPPASLDLLSNDIKFPESKIGESGAVVAQLSSRPGGTKIDEAVSEGPKKEEPRPVSPTKFKIDLHRKFKIIGGDMKPYGPVSGAELLKWIADARIDWQSPAQAEGSLEWKPLSDFAVGIPSTPGPSISKHPITSRYEKYKKP